VSGLVGFGIPEIEAKRHEGEIEKGKLFDRRPRG
jgi:hypothetical protein